MKNYYCDMNTSIYNIFTEKSKELINMGVPVNKESTYLGQNIFTSYRAQELLHENMITDRSIIDVIAFTNLSNHFSLSSFAIAHAR